MKCFKGLEYEKSIVNNILLNYANYSYGKEQDTYILSFMLSLRLYNSLKQAAAMNFEK